MPTYRYEAQDRDGRRATGEIVADDREQAVQQLAGEGWRSIRLSEIAASGAATADEPSRRATLSTAETVDLAELLGMLAGADLPLDAGLKAAADELPPGRFRRALAAVSAALRQGAPLGEALAGESWRFPLHLRALVLAGLHSGRLGAVLEEFVSLERRAALLRRQVALSLAYPALLLMMLAGLGAYFSLVVSPGMADVFDDFNSQLPVQTVILIELSKGGFYLQVAALLTMLALWLILWLTTDLAELRSVLKAAPLIGPIARWSSLARFARLLALLVENRLELAESLRLAGAGSRDYELLSACRHAAQRVEAGAELRTALDRSPAFGKSLGPVVEWGQRAAALPEALRTAGEMFDGRVQAQLSYVRMIFPALTLLLVLWGVLFLISAVTLPMITLIERLW